MKSVLVVFGGQSTEHDISIITAINSIIKPLELTKKYLVKPVYIAKNGNWYLDDRLKKLNLYQEGLIDQLLKKIKPIKISFDNGFVIYYKNGLKTEKLKPDIVFPAMHGTKGEDGALMGLLELGNIAYVGCDLSASALSMNKVLAKQLAMANQIDVTKFVVISRFSFENDLNEKLRVIRSSLKYPLFIKPAHLGSSIGISRVKNETELKNGLEVAFYYDNLVLVEEEVANLIELTLPIIGNERPQPAYLERPLLKSADFFDFDTKYMRGGKKGSAQGEQGAQGYSEVPAKIEKTIYKKAETLGLKVYNVFSLSGIARVDMLVDAKTKKVYFNEINPLPGSLYSHNFQKFGLSNIELVEKLVSLAEERFATQQKIQKVFSTNYLKQF